jgi:hypothetical protein
MGTDQMVLLCGRPISMADAQTAAICRNWSADLATCNVNDFLETGVHVLNPWEAAQGIGPLVVGDACVTVNRLVTSRLI